MKITPFILFLILLVVLVLSIVFSKYLPLRNIKEGLVGFNSSPSNETINIPLYNNNQNKKVFKLYDNLYFDVKNGNLIEVDGNSSTSASGANNISKIYVTSRDQNSYEYNTESVSAASQISSVSSKFNQFIYSTKCANTDKYIVIYISYNTDTLIHLFKINNDKSFNLIFSYLFSSYSAWVADWKNKADNLKYSTPTTDTESNNIVLKEPLYSNSNNLYKMSRAVFYDVYIGNLILKTIPSDGSSSHINIYDRSGLSISSKQDANTLVTVNSGTFTPWIIKDPDNNLVIANPYSTKTVICILKLNNTDGTITLGNTVRFTDKVVDNGTSISVESPSSSSGSTGNTGSTGSSANTCNTTDMVCLLSNVLKNWFPNGITNNQNDDLNKWYAYMNSVVSAGNSNDYILKTQIVPPVCPSCPSCNCGSGVCSDCGGKGGSGTKNGYTGSTGRAPQQSSITGDILNKYDNDRKWDHDDRFHHNDLGETVSNVTGDVTGLAGSAIGTAGGIINNAVNTAGGLLYSTGSGAVNLLKSAGQGPVGLNYQNQPGAQQRDIYYGSNANQNTPIDAISQYGALQSRAGNYMPMTADFSAFGK